VKKEEAAAVAGPGWEKVTKPKKGPRDAGAGGPARRTQRDFVLMEHGKNVLEGLELHNNVLSPQEQARVSTWCEEQLAQGKRGFRGGHTYMQSTVPKKVVDSAGATARRADRSEKWTRGKGREVLQYGVFYDYGGHRIDEDKEVEPMPEELQKLAKLVCARGVIPPTKVPDSCIVNFYSEGDCIPPHIDHEHYPRPFFSLSLGCDAGIAFGTHIKTLGPAAFAAPFTLTLPKGSVVVLQGAAADVAQHCIPAVPGRRISITMRIIPADVLARMRQAHASHE